MTRPPQRSAVLIAVGDEVLGGFTLDTNSHWLAQRLREAGWPVLRIEVVADRAEAIVDSIHRAVADPGVARVVVTGGLGPTPDDRTLEAVATATGRPLEEHPDALAHVRGIVERMHAAGWAPTAEISAANRKMTLAPRGATVLANRRGMASGIVCALEGEDRWLLVLPGVPREMEAIVAEEAIPRLFGGGVARTVIELRYRNAIEAHFSRPMEELGAAFPAVSFGSYPQSDRRELVLRISGENRPEVEAAAARLRALRPPDQG